MQQFVLVHGAWHGAWCWARILPALRAAGYLAHAVTLTGVGDREHLLSPGISLATHIDDVVNLIRCEELDEVVLVGHSYGGMVITGVADRLLKQLPGVLQHLVYVDGTAPRPGESWSSSHAPEVIAERVAAVEASGGLGLPPPDSAVWGLTGADREWVNRRMTPQPFSLYREPLNFDGARVDDVPRTFIDCHSPAAPNLDPMRRRVRSEPGWSVIEIATGHDVMISAPSHLVDALLDCVGWSPPAG